MGCLDTTSCGTGMAFASADNGVGTAGTSSASFAGSNNGVVTGADAFSSTGGMATPTTTIALTLTPNSWEHNVTFTSGSSAAATSVGTWAP
jgi:hypothetical protein